MDCCIAAFDLSHNPFAHIGIEDEFNEEADWRHWRLALFF